MSGVTGVAQAQLSRDEMLQALSASFPVMSKRLAEDFSSSYQGQGGLFVCGDVTLGDHPIFPNIYYGGDEYDGYLLIAFRAWIEARGWGEEMHDVGQFILFPLSHWSELEYGDDADFA